MAKKKKTATSDPSIPMRSPGELLATVSLPLEPVPASRPRVTRWGTYYAKTYKTWMEAAAGLLVPGGLELHPKQPLEVYVHSVSTKARTSKLAYPRYDTDNTAKAVLDALTKAGGYWYDDDQVVSLHSSKRFKEPEENPGTRVEIWAAR